MRIIPNHSGRSASKWKMQTGRDLAEIGDRAGGWVTGKQDDVCAVMAKDSAGPLGRPSSHEAQPPVNLTPRPQPRHPNR